MNIESGWRFCTADFSMIAVGQNVAGFIALIRSPKQRKLWHKLAEEVIESDDCPPLHIVETGMSFEEALAKANNVDDLMSWIHDCIDENINAKGEIGAK